MSKGMKILIWIMAVLLIGGWAGWMLWPRKTDSFVEKEISIKQTTIPEAEKTVYEDWAGFRFEHPKSLKVEEVETDDETIYSSLELTAVDGKKLLLRIVDSQFKDFEEWKKEFEADNVAVGLREIYWVDIPGLQLRYGAPKKLLTVALEDGVIYRLEGPTDEGGFWDEAHQLILNSFEFDESVMIKEAEEEIEVETDEEADIILLEETITE